MKSGIIKFRFASSMLFGLVIGGCFKSTIYYAPEDLCSRPLDPKMSRIEVRRKSDFPMNEWLWRITDSDQPIGELASSSKLCWDRYPGNAVIESYGDPAPRTCPPISSKFSFDASTGKTYHILIEPELQGCLYGTNKFNFKFDDGKTD